MDASADMGDYCTVTSRIHTGAALCYVVNPLRYRHSVWTSDYPLSVSRLVERGPSSH